MSRRQWTGLGAIMFGAVMLIGVLTSGSTPESTDAGAVARYTDYWKSIDNQDKAALGSIILTYACVLLVALAAGLRHLLAAADDGPLPGLVLGAGAMSAGLLGVGSALMNGVGVAGAETGYEADGNHGLLVESIGYYTLTSAMMAAAAMAVAVGLSNRRARVLPQWTIALAVLLGLAALGNIFTAWIGFMLLPAWAAVVGICLLALRDSAPATA